jgi:hypothetical protein
MGTYMLFEPLNPDFWEMSMLLEQLQDRRHHGDRKCFGKTTKMFQKSSNVEPNSDKRFCRENSYFSK